MGVVCALVASVTVKNCRVGRRFGHAPATPITLIYRTGGIVIQKLACAAIISRHRRMRAG